MRRHLKRHDLEHWASSFFDALRTGTQGGDGRTGREPDPATGWGEPGAQG